VGGALAVAMVVPRTEETVWVVERVSKVARLGTVVDSELTVVVTAGVD